MPTATQEKPSRTKLKRFRLLRGGHLDPDAMLIDEHGDPKPILIEIAGKKRPNPEINEGRGFEPGDVIETDKSLAVLFNSPGQKKFEEVGSDGVTVKPKAAINVSKFLNRMSIPQLKAFAEDEEPEIDLTGAVQKVDIVNRIVNAMG